MGSAQGIGTERYVKFETITAASTIVTLKRKTVHFNSFFRVIAF